MLTTTLLLATLAVGIDTGYEPTADGGLEYIIQIPPDLLENLEPGEVIKSELPEDLQGVKRYRIQVGTGRLPKIHAPANINETKIPTAAKPISEAVQTSAHSPIQEPEKKSPFEMGPTRHTTNVGNTNPNARYGSLSPSPTANGYGTNNFNNTAQTSTQNQNPLQLPPPPDGLDHLYGTTGANPGYNNPNLNGQPNPNQINPATGLQNVPAGYPNNQYVNAQNPNYQFPNQYPNGQMPNYQYPNNQYPNQQFNNMNNGYPNNGMPNQNMPGSYPNNGMQNPNFVNNTGQGNPQMPNGYQNGQQNGQPQIGSGGNNTQTADNRNSSSFGSNSNVKPAEIKERTVTFREEVSPGDVSSADRKKAEEEPKPWLPMYVTGLAAVGSLLGNLYLAWMWLETRRRYRQSIIERTLVA